MTQNFTIRQARLEDDTARGALLAPTYVAEAADIGHHFRDFGDLAPGIVRLLAEDANGAILGAVEEMVRL